MARNYLSDEQKAELEKSKWVKKVTQANVQFTSEFKEIFLRLYREGNSPTRIVERLGINPEIIGKRRIDSLSARIKQQNHRPEGFHRKENSSKGKRRKLTFDTKEEEAAYYKELSERLKQENEFLKKIQALRRK